MSLEVVMQLPRCNKDYIKQLMHFQVSCFSIMEDLADVVHWALDAMNPPGGGPMHSPPWAQVPGTPGPQDPKGPLGAGTQRLHGCRGPKWPLGARTWQRCGPRDLWWAFRSWDSSASSTLDPSAGSGF
jgi:hypothetical protein